MADQIIIDRLRNILKDPLPGWDAQKRLMPEGRQRLELPQFDDLHPAAVLIALFPRDDKWHFPLIKRSSDGFAHSGQIALPGGRKEGSETDTETALREAHEEVNLSSEQVEVIGKMSPLPIPVSLHMVQPIVGMVNSTPHFQPDPREVEEIFYLSLEELVSTPITFEKRSFQDRTWDIPHFHIQGHKVWGATGMILSEFRQLISQII
ncbi:MAG: CoA pyrophosphatase [Candidatus Marinimicrobia bacterium]|nr:CoA pyrophosphatase [Candidatus Neomarinimicrobiota bacterium]